MLQIYLYALLVVPKELLKAKTVIKNNFNNLFSGYIKSIEDKNEKKYEINSNYENESSNNMDFYRHIRNAVAHSRCVYRVDNGICLVKFTDQDNGNKHSCSIEVPTYVINQVIGLLQQTLMKILNENVCKKVKDE